MNRHDWLKLSEKNSKRQNNTWTETHKHVNTHRHTHIKEVKSFIAISIQKIRKFLRLNIKITDTDKRTTLHEAPNIYVPFT